MNNKKELHVISISGGKDSAALAVYLKDKYPNREFEYIFLDTEEELPETIEKEMIKLKLDGVL